MADPRGLSGAVFQPTPVRDFIQDFQRQQQLTGRAVSAAKKAEKDFFDAYGADYDAKEIPATYQPSYFKVVDDYNKSARDLYELKQTDPRAFREQQVKQKRKQKQLMLAQDLTKQRIKHAQARENYIKEHRDTLTPDRIAELTAEANEFYNPTQEFRWDEEEAVMYFGDKPVAEAYGDHRVLLPPQGPKVDWKSGMLDKTAKGVDGFKYTDKETGAVFTNKQQVFDSFDDAYASGSPFAVEGVKEQISIKLNKPVEDITDEQVQAQVEADPSLVDKARDSYYRYVDQGIAKSGGRAPSDDDEGGFTKLENTKGKYYQLGDIKNRPSKFAVSLSPSDNVKIAVPLDTQVVDEDGNVKEDDAGKPITTKKTFELKVSDIVRADDGKYYARAYDRESDEFIPLEGQQRAQVEQALGVQSLDEWYNFKKEKAGATDDVSGMPTSIPNKPSSQPPLEPQKKTVKDILKPKG